MHFVERWVAHIPQVDLFKDEGPNIPSRKMRLVGELSKVSAFVFARISTKKHCFNMERVFRTVIFWVGYPSRVFHH